MIRLFPSCGFSGTAVRILEQIGVPFEVVDVLANDRYVVVVVVRVVVVAAVVVVVGVEEERSGKVLMLLFLSQ